jgi:hypothetical protein
MSAGCLGLLTAHTNSPKVPQASMKPDLSHTIEILAQLEVQVVRHKLLVLAVPDVLPPVQKPVRNLKLPRVLNNRHDAIHFLVSELPGAFTKVHFRFLADQVRKPSANAFDRR